MPSTMLVRGCFAASVILAWVGISPLDLKGARDAVAGEIILTPQKAGPSTSASEQRSRARAYQRDDMPTVVVPQEEVEGVLSPRQSRPESRARDNRLRAGERRAEPELPGSNIIGPGVAGSAVPGTAGAESGSAREKARDNRARAAGYSRGTSDVVSARVGADGIPTIACKDVDNVAGRIGDDVKSGGVIIVMRDGKPIKVRCQ